MISLVKFLLLSTIKHSDLIQRSLSRFATNMSNFPEEKCLGLKNSCFFFFCYWFLSNGNAKEIPNESSIANYLSHPAFSFLFLSSTGKILRAYFGKVTEDLGSCQQQYALKLKCQRDFTLSLYNDCGLNVWFRYFTWRVLCIFIAQVSER